MTPGVDNVSVTYPIAYTKFNSYRVMISTIGATDTRTFGVTHTSSSRFSIKVNKSSTSVTTNVNYVSVGY